MAYLDPSLNALCKALLKDNKYRKVNKEDVDEWSDPRFSTLVMEVTPSDQGPRRVWHSPPPPSPPSDATVDYEPLPFPPPGWEAKGGVWFGPIE